MKKRGSTVLVMGLGLHGGGIGAANYFTSRANHVIITDLKSEDELKESIKRLKNRDKIRFVLGGHNLSDFKNVDLIIRNPAVHLSSPYIQYALKNGVKVDTDIGIFLNEIKKITNNVIGITGTKGKSTTATLIYNILKKKYPDTLICGNIAVSVLDVLDKVKRDSYIILELSSFQLGAINDKCISPGVSVFTNLMEDHLNYYKNMEEYFNDKTVIYKFQKKGDVLVINRDDILYKKIKPNKGVRIVSFGLSDKFSGEGSFIDNDKIYIKSKDRVIFITNLKNVKLAGRHNLYNILASVTVSYLKGVNPEDINEIVSNFKGIEHRLEYVANINNISFYNDSSATTPDAAICGIKSFNNPVNLIAGGFDKRLDLTNFLVTIEKAVNNIVLLKGNGTERLMKGLLKKNFKLFDNLKDAVEYAYKISVPGDVVLFSPGFASFGMFQNEFHRGREFKRFVNEINDQE